jgi:hypothetical protein
MADADPSELDQLRRENARLIGLLEAHGIAWRCSGPASTVPAPISEAAAAGGAGGAGNLPLRGRCSRVGVL